MDEQAERADKQTNQTERNWAEVSRIEANRNRRPQSKFGQLKRRKVGKSLQQRNANIDWALSVVRVRCTDGRGVCVNVSSEALKVFTQKLSNDGVHGV